MCFFLDCLQNVQVETQATITSLNHSISDVVSSNTTTSMIAAAAISTATITTSTVTSTTVSTSSVVSSSSMMSSSTPVQPVHNFSGDNCKDIEITCLWVIIVICP